MLAAPKTPLYDQVYHQLREMIVAGVFTTGEPISEVQLSERLAVSRTPVREAVRRLVAENLLELSPRGLRLYTPSVEDLAEVYYTRAMLEGAAAGLAARQASKALLSTLRRVTKDAERSVVAEDAGPKLTRLNGEFHGALVAASGNRRIQEQLSSLESIIRRYRRISLMFPDHLRRSYDEHMRIVELMEGGRPEAVEEFVRGHIQRAGARIVRAVLRMEGGDLPIGPTVQALLASEA